MRESWGHLIVTGPGEILSYSQNPQLLFAAMVLQLLQIYVRCHFCRYMYTIASADICTPLLLQIYVRHCFCRYTYATFFVDIRTPLLLRIYVRTPLLLQIYVRRCFWWDSDIEAFSHNPVDMVPLHQHPLPLHKGHNFIP